MRMFGVLTAVIVSACASQGVPDRANFMSVNPGMSREEVVSLLGQPGDRTFRGRGEALQYCRPGIFDEYTTIWLVDGRVASLTRMEADTGIGSCFSYPAIDWGQAPPDVRISIENR